MELSVLRIIIDVFRGVAQRMGGAACARSIASLGLQLRGEGNRRSMVDEVDVYSSMANAIQP